MASEQERNRSNQVPIQIPINGIHRNIPDNNVPDDACSEVINARYEDNAWRPVGEKQTLYNVTQSSNYDLTLYKHRSLTGGYFLGYNAKSVANTNYNHRLFAVHVIDQQVPSVYELIKFEDGEKIITTGELDYFFVVFTDKRAYYLRYNTEFDIAHSFNPVNKPFNLLHDLIHP